MLLRDISLPRLRRASFMAFENEHAPRDYVKADLCIRFYERHPFLQEVHHEFHGPPCDGLSEATLLPQLERFVGTLPDCLSILDKPERPSHLNILWHPRSSDLDGSSDIVLARPENIVLIRLNLHYMVFTVSDAIIDLIDTPKYL